ncbi:MAG TPA: hypothetical protein VF278_17545 [Pirellulales bacterium]
MAPFLSRTSPTNSSEEAGLLYLKTWLAAHPDARPQGLVYFGPINPTIGRHRLRRISPYDRGVRRRDAR